MEKTRMINTLVQLATIDNELAGRETKWLMEFGAKLGLSTEEVAGAFRNPQTPPNFNHLTEDERFEYLYNLIQLMKVDGKVFTSEISFCERFAKRLGYKTGVIRALSGHIYSDPSITADRLMLQNKAKKYLHQRV